MESKISIEVAYARPDTQAMLPMSVNRGTTAKEAIQQSGLLEQFTEIDLESTAIGIFGEQVDLGYTLESGDRIEIYRPLQIDPKQARKHRAELAKSRNES